MSQPGLTDRKTEVDDENLNIGREILGQLIEGALLHTGQPHRHDKAWKPFSVYWPFVRYIYRSLVDSFYKRPVWEFDVSFVVSL